MGGSPSGHGAPRGPCLRASSQAWRFCVPIPGLLGSVSARVLQGWGASSPLQGASALGLPLDMELRSFTPIVAHQRASLGCINPKKLARGDQKSELVAELSVG